MRRIASKLISYIDQALARAYRVRHPDPIECRLIGACAPLVRMCQPNDRWNLHVFAPEWAKAVSCPPIRPQPPAKSVFIYCGYQGVFTQNVVLATMLAWRGHRVTLGYLPKLQRPSKPPLEDRPSAKPYLRFVMDRLEEVSAGTITAIDLSEDRTPVVVDEDLVRKQAHYDTVMAFQMEGIDLSDPAVRKLYEHMLQVGRTAQTAFRNHFAKRRYDVAVIGNGTTFEGAHACAVLRELGQPVNGTEKFAFHGCRVINHGDNFLGGQDLDYLWENRQTLGYTREPYASVFIEQARRSMRERSENSTQTWLWELQHAVGQSEEEAFRVAGIRPGTPFVLVCPNVVFDAGYGKITNVFPSMKDWLIETVRFLLDKTDHSIVVRAHPGEGLFWGGKEPVHEFLASEGVRPSERLVIIPGQSKVNTYRLMDRCLFGVVFSSSTGLEMAMTGKHVVTASNVVYANRGFTHDAETKSQYFGQLYAVSDRLHKVAMAKEKQDLALLFYFVYHWVAQYPYPYDKPSALIRCPPKKQLRSADMQKYLPYLDLLVMTEAEFRSSASRYLDAERILLRLKEAM